MPLAPPVITATFPSTRCMTSPFAVQAIVPDPARVYAGDDPVRLPRVPSTPAAGHFFDRDIRVGDLDWRQASSSWRRSRTPPAATKTPSSATKATVALPDSPTRTPCTPGRRLRHEPTARFAARSGPSPRSAQSARKTTKSLTTTRSGASQRCPSLRGATTSLWPSELQFI